MMDDEGGSWSQLKSYTEADMDDLPQGLAFKLALSLSRNGDGREHVHQQPHRRGGAIGQRGHAVGVALAVGRGA